MKVNGNEKVHVQHVQDAMALASVGALKIESDVVLDLSIDLPPVLVDTVQMQQVVLNLIRNSIEALTCGRQRAQRPWSVAVVPVCDGENDVLRVKRRD